MKYLKKFESVQDEIEIGDYVLIRTHSSLPNVKEFINNTIGVVSNIIYNYDDIIVGYFDVPKNIEKFFNKSNSKFPFVRRFGNDRVCAFGKTKEEVELKASMNKYNL